MTKAKHNKILVDLLVQTQLGNFREVIILMTQMMAADFQIQLMQKLMAGPELYVRQLGDYLKITPRSSFVKVVVLP